MEGDQYSQRGIMRRRGACAREKDHHARPNMKATRNWRCVRRSGGAASARGNLINGSEESVHLELISSYSHFPFVPEAMIISRSPTTIIVITQEPRPLADRAVLVLRPISLFDATQKPPPQITHKPTS